MMERKTRRQKISQGERTMDFSQFIQSIIDFFAQLTAFQQILDLVAFILGLFGIG